MPNLLCLTASVDIEREARRDHDRQHRLKTATNPIPPAIISCIGISSPDPATTISTLLITILPRLRLLRTRAARDLLYIGF